MSKFSTAFNPPLSAGVEFKSPSLTQPQFAKDCDINVILARLQRGDLSVLKKTGAYYDATGFPEDLHSVLQLQAKARQVWESNSDIAEKFGNPEAFIDFLSNEENREEAIKLGVLPKPVVENPVKDSVVSGANLEGQTPKPAEVT